MSIRILRLVAGVSMCLLPWAWSPSVNGQQPEPPVAASEAAQKAKILDSDCWHRATFELNEWFRTQTIYTPEEVARLRSDFKARVDTMSASELQDVISDMEAKFRLLDRPEVREVRTWFAHYMAVLSERRREEVLREIPNFATMTASQLKQEIMKIQRKKSSQARFDQNRQARVNDQLQANRAAQNAARNRTTTQRSAYRSPYRPAPRERPFDDAQIGPRRSMSVGPGGGVWMNLSF